MLKVISLFNIITVVFDGPPPPFTETYNRVINFLTYNLSKEQYVLPVDDLRIGTCRGVLSVLV